MPLSLVILVCTAMPWSPYKDHCREEVVPIFDTMMPTTCVQKAPEIIAAQPDRFADGTITEIRCRPRDRTRPLA